MTTADTRAPVATQPVPAPGPRARRPSRRDRRQASRAPRHLQSNLTAYLMITPMVVLLGIFVLWPLCYAVYLSGYRVSFYQGRQWVGLQFYRYVLTDPRFWHAIKIGLFYSLMTVPTGLLVSLLLAIFIKSLKGTASAFMKTIVYVPAVLSSVIASVVFTFMYQDAGVVNWAVGWFGVGPVAWLNDTQTVLPAVAVPGVWIGLGVSTLILVAALLDIPESYYESAKLDGASVFQQTWYITLPMLRNVFLFLLVTGFTLTIQEFQLPLIMTAGGPVDASNTPNLYIFNSFRDFTPYSTSFSLAAALLLFVVLGSISMVIFRLLRSEKAMDA